MNTLSVTVEMKACSRFGICSKHFACCCGDGTLSATLAAEMLKSPLLTQRAASHTCCRKLSALMTHPVKRPMSTITSSSSPLLTGSARSTCVVSNLHTQHHANGITATHRS